MLFGDPGAIPRIDYLVLFEVGMDNHKGHREDRYWKIENHKLSFSSLAEFFRKNFCHLFKTIVMKKPTSAPVKPPLIALEISKTYSPKKWDIKPNRIPEIITKLLSLS